MSSQGQEWYVCTIQDWVNGACMNGNPQTYLEIWRGSCQFYHMSLDIESLILPYIGGGDPNSTMNMEWGPWFHHGYGVPHLLHYKHTQHRCFAWSLVVLFCCQKLCHCYVVNGQVVWNLRNATILKWNFVQVNGNIKAKLYEEINSGVSGWPVVTQVKTSGNVLVYTMVGYLLIKIIIVYTVRYHCHYESTYRVLQNPCNTHLQSIEVTSCVWLIIKWLWSHFLYRHIIR